MLTLLLHQYDFIFTAWVRVIFLQACVIHSVHGLPGMHHRSHDRGGSASKGVCLQGRYAWGGASGERGCLPPGGSASRGVGQTPPPIRYYGIRSTSGRYASYWNAFLCLFILQGGADPEHSDSESDDDGLNYHFERDSDSSDSDSDDNLMVSQELRPGFGSTDVNTQEENSNTNNARNSPQQSDLNLLNSNLSKK